MHLDVSLGMIVSRYRKHLKPLLFPQFEADNPPSSQTTSMDRRIPSKSSALTNRSSIRHRSGVFSPKTSTEDPENSSSAALTGNVKRKNSLSEQSERTDHTLTVQVEDTDDVDRGAPTVLLVRRSRASARAKPLPALPGDEFLTPLASSSRDFLAAPLFQATSPSLSLLVAADQERLDELALSPVPLTPQPPQPQREHSAPSMRTTGTRVTDTLALPTPDYPAHRGGLGRRLTSYFSRLRARNAPPAPPARTDSDYSTYSEESTAVSERSRALASLPEPATETSIPVPREIKDRRPILVSAFSTTDKFTQKFPRPRSVRSLSYAEQIPGGGRRSAMAANMLAEGEGLGLELRVDRWTWHKWCLVLSVCSVLVYGTAGLICAILTWFRAWNSADVMYVADYDLLVFITLSASILLFTALIGFSGTLLNSRPILAVYGLLLWPAFLSLLVVGYTSYKRSAFALDRKLNLAWSQWYTPLGRRVIQDALRCCGFYSALHEAAPSKSCYPRTPLPGCKGKLWRFERANLALIWGTVFSLVPVHILNIFVSLLCANHVTRTFGKGITPKRYRLNGEDVRADADALMKVLSDVRPVARPGFTRAPSSGVFREDRAYYDSTDEWEEETKMDTVGLGIRSRYLDQCNL
ncbi:hypothetical protein BN946_scf184970.g64 [Trametes cinnabarina]|uniref:Tetraspanin Tsp2 n=1 Tax=Pycnoporus cinnabarinus TaxID=5643 RepID=A0A060SCJ5_PYCCI|nr:hypothetical protein BN946_scf184970.g64 [Trametes cinnabarina]